MKSHLRYRVPFTAFLAVFSAAFVFAAPTPPPSVTESSPISFKTTMADLHRAALSGDDRPIPSDQALLIDAEIGSITVRADTDEAFAAEVELVGGSWIGEDKVELYRAYAIFESPQFRDLFSRRSAIRLLPGDKLIVLCRYLGIGVDYDETTPVPVLEAFDLRRID
jgi:hypothetical protein